MLVLLSCFQLVAQDALRPLGSNVASAMLEAEPRPRNVGSNQFGRSLAMLGDVDGDKVPDVAIGAPADSIRGEDSGCVYLLSGRDGHVLSTIPGRGPGDRYGMEVARTVDFDGDDRADVAIRAGFPDGSTYSAVHCHSSRDGSRLPVVRIDTQSSGADVDADGVADVLVPDVDGATQPHLVRMLSGKDRRVLRTIKELRPLGNDEGFGQSAAWIGDVDHDGVSDVAVGCFERLARVTTTTSRCSLDAMLAASGISTPTGR